MSAAVADRGFINAQVIIVVRAIRDTTSLWLSSTRLLPSDAEMTSPGVKGYSSTPLSMLVNWVAKDFIGTMPSGASQDIYESLIMVAGAAALGVGTPMVGVHRGPDPGRPEVSTVDILLPRDLRGDRRLSYGTSDHLEVRRLDSLPTINELQALTLHADIGEQSMRSALRRLTTIPELAPDAQGPDQRPGAPRGPIIAPELLELAGPSREQLLSLASMLTGFVVRMGKVSWLFPLRRSARLWGLGDMTIGDRQLLVTAFDAVIEPLFADPNVTGILFSLASVLSPNVRDLTHLLSVDHPVLASRARWEALLGCRQFAANDAVLL